MSGNNRIIGVGNFPHDPLYPPAVQKHISFDLARFTEETDNSHEGFYYYVRSLFPTCKHTYRYSKVAGAYIVQSPVKILGWMPIEYYVVKEHCKVGY